MVAALIALVAFARGAEAKRRIVVLDFSGPKAELFEAQVMGGIKKGGAGVAASKWTDAADELGATKMTAKNVAKIAAKLNVDGVVIGSVDRRGTRYFVHVRLRAGSNGENAAEVELVARSGKLTSSDLDEVKEQIVGAFDNLDPAGDSGDDDGDDAEPVAKGKGKGKGKHVAAADDDDSVSADDSGDAEPVAKGKGKGKDKAKGKGKHAAAADDDDSGDDSADADTDKHRGFRGHDKDQESRGKDKVKGGDDDADADAEPVAKGKSKGKDKGKGKGKAKDRDADDSDSGDAASADDEPVARGRSKGKGKGKAKDRDANDGDGDGDRVASRDGDRDGDAASDDETIGASAEVAGDPRHRPFDALAGLSFTGRRLSFTTSAGLTNKPQGYRSGVPVTGIFVGGDLYPLAFSGKNHSITRDFGLTVLLDRVLSISSQLAYTDGTGASQTATLSTLEEHYAFGLVFRHTLGKTAMDPTLYASIRYNRSKFVINKDEAPMGVAVDIPNTNYTYVDPGVGIRYPLTPKIALDGGARFLFITNTGEMQETTQYGGATVLGFDVDAGGDYQLNKQWFLHAGVHVSTIGFSFKGNGDLSNNRDGDPTTVDVSAARDTYYSGMVTAGYLY